MQTHDEATKVGEPGDETTGCPVDWGWIKGLKIESAASDLRRWRVRFTNGQVLTIQAAHYRGNPFLAFNPYKPSDS